MGFSPEVCRSKPYGRKSDVWALGVVLYELASLVVPFNARTVPAVAWMICKDEPDPLSDEYSPELHELTSLLLKKDPADRPAAKAVASCAFVLRFLFHADADEGHPEADEMQINSAETSFNNSMSPTSNVPAQNCTGDLAMASTAATALSNKSDARKLQEHAVKQVMLG